MLRISVCFYNGFLIIFQLLKQQFSQFIKKHFWKHYPKALSTFSYYHYQPAQMNNHQHWQLVSSRWKLFETYVEILMKFNVR